MTENTDRYRDTKTENGKTISYLVHKQIGSQTGTETEIDTDRYRDINTGKGNHTWCTNK